MSGEWLWDDAAALMLLHDESLAKHGGAAGIRDQGMFESATGRARNLALYGEPDSADLAAAYAYGLARNHAFVDGNKRAGFLVSGLFLYFNGQRLVSTQSASIKPSPTSA